MKAGAKTTGATRLLWSLVLGLGLVLGLLWVMMPRSAAEAQTDIGPGLIVEPSSAVVRDQAVIDDITTMAAISADTSLSSPPLGGKEGGMPPDFAPPHDRKMPPGGPLGTLAGGSSSAFVPASAEGLSMLASASARTLAGQSPGLYFSAQAWGQDGFVVDLAYDAVWGYVSPGDTITVARTVGGDAYGSAEADGVGFFWTPLWQSNGQPADVVGGNTIAVYLNGSLDETIVPRAITGRVDVLGDQVTGTVAGLTTGTPVTATLGDTWVGFIDLPQAVDTVDASGDFVIDFSGTADLGPNYMAQVYYCDANGNAIVDYAVPSDVVRVTGWNTVEGYATPGTSVGATVYITYPTDIRSGEGAEAEGPYGWYSINVGDIEYGDVIEVEIGVGSGNTVLVATDYMEMRPDAAADQITGIAPADATVRGYVWDEFDRIYADDTTVAAGGVYTLNLAADLRTGHRPYAAFVDPNGNEVGYVSGPPHIRAYPMWNGITAVSDYPHQPISYTVDTGSEILTMTGSCGSTNGCDWMDLPPFGPGTIITAELSSMSMTMTVADVSLHTDTAADTVYGDANIPGQMDVTIIQWRGGYPANGYAVTGTITASPYTATFPGFDVRDGMEMFAYHYDAVDGNRTFVMSEGGWETPYFEVDMEWNGVGGVPPTADETITVTLYTAGGVELTSTNWDDDGNPWRFWYSNFGGYDLESGRWITLTGESGWVAGLQIPPLTLELDTETDMVWGEGPKALLYLDGGRDESGFGGFLPCDDYILDTTSWGHDLEWGDNVNVTYQAPNGNRVRTGFGFPQMNVSYDMEGGSGVWGFQSIAGNTILVTVTNPSDDIVATGTTYPGSWGGPSPTGYVLSLPPNSIQPGYTVTVNWGDGFVDAVNVLGITGYPNEATNIVTGTGPADGMIDSIGVNDVWGGNGGIEQIPIDSSGVYTADFGNDIGWDIQYGDYFNTWYPLPRGHNINYDFWLPAPELEVQKETVSGHAIPGGRVMYHIRYSNNGNGDAENTLITDTLPTSTTYAANSGGFPAITDGSIVTFNLGTVTPKLNPWDEEDFYVSLIVDSGVPTQTHLNDNCVWISTSSPGDYNMSNNQDYSGGAWVEDGQWGLWVDKRPEPNDPHPGQTFQYVIEYGSDGGGATGPAWLTDTLPTGTSFVSWSEEHGWDGLWTEVITTGGQFVLYAPAGVPGGDMGGRIRLTLLLDGGVSIGTRLENTVVITTSGDIDPGNNEDFDNQAQASGARYDMQVDKYFDNGQLVPGGEIYYSIQYRNQGNAAVNAWVTDTLPAGTSFDSAWTQGWDSQSLAPSVVTADYVVWDLGIVDVSDNSGFHVRLNISNTVTPGDILTNCATVGITETEDTPWDNESCVATTIYTAGQPNLYVTKELRENYEPGHGNINYRIYFGNFGDQTVYNVHLTDTLPLSTTYGGHEVRWWGDSQYTATTPSGELRVLFERIEPGQSGQIELSVNLDDSNARMLWYTNTVEIDTPSDDANPTDNSDTYVAFSGGEVDRVDLWVARDANAWGRAQPNAPITLTTVVTQLADWVDGGGNWNIDNVPAINPGDTITVTAGDGLLPVVIHMPDPYTAYASSITDTVWGQIDAEQVTVDLDNGPEKDVQTDGSGAYSAVFSDIPRGGRGEVRYNTEFNYADVCFRRSFQTQDLIINVNYRDNWVEGNYEAGHTVWLTVTESDRTTVKGTAVLTTGVVPWWGGQTGFSTNWQGWTRQPDIQPGDWVYGLVHSASYTTTVQVGDIDAEVDTSADTISGTLNASWLAPDLVTVRCEIHEENGPNGIEVYNVDPNGGAFLCNFGGAWDIVPGTNVAVNYTEPDGDQVQTRPSNPAPQVSINKWANGNPGEGGNFVFQVQYGNNGGLDAENTVITDTLLGGMTYLTDTSGFPHTGSGSGPIVWDLGALPANSGGQFDVFVQVTAVASDTITNTVQITTSNPYDQGEPHEKESEWSGHVEANDTHLNVGKWAWTHDPAPGYDFVYSVNVCNNGSTGSSEVTLSDTLHPSMTLQSWWSQHAGWTEVLSSSHQLIASRPSIPGYWCGEVYLRVHLDSTAWSGMYITNTAVITASNDMEDNDNEAFWDGWVNDPHTNLYINKHWNWGQLVPGGELHYNINYNNNGNVPVTSTVRIIDTLPVSTTFVAAWRHDQYGQHPVMPTQVTAAYVVWEINGLDNGYGDGFEVVLDVDYAAPPGAVLTNTVEISLQSSEDSYDDNISTVVETLYDHGPNLRVHKSGYWHDWGSSTRQAEYNVTVENVGDEHVDWVTITDAYPSEMRMEGGVNLNYGRWWNWHDYSASHYFTVTLESLYPGDRMDINFTIITDTSPLPFGLVFTNTVEVMLDPDDTNPADNVDNHVLTTGPDLYVEKTLAGGDWLPGDLITFSLRFGNAQEGTGWWNMQGNARLEDVLPDGLEYVSANPPYDMRVGSHLFWFVGQLGAGHRDKIYLTARITDTATGLDTFTNWVEIESDQPGDDVEPYYDNNEDTHDVVIAQPYFQVGKVYESNRVAGMPVTYTLTVTNTGQAQGVNVVLSDTLPTGMTYGGSDGALTGGDVIWNFTSIASYGGTASGWFSATLPCTTGSVTNDEYRVVGSDEGVESAPGAAVAFTVIAPALDAAFDVSSDTVMVDTTIYFTDTSTTDGAPIVAWEWDFGDGSVHIFTQDASHTYLSDDTFTVRLTVTDTCGYSDEQTAVITVNAPALAAAFDYAPDPAYILDHSTVVFTDTSTTDGPAIVAWEWDFGDGSAHASTQNASHEYTTVGTYTVGLVVTDTLGYSDDEVKTGIVVVSRSCNPLTSVTFTYAPLQPVILSPVVFTATHEPFNATTPITYIWDFGDGVTTTVATASVQHTYTVSGTQAVRVTAYNLCTLAGVTHQENITVAPLRIFLPLVLRNY